MFKWKERGVSGHIGNFRRSIICVSVETGRGKKEGIIGHIDPISSQRGKILSEVVSGISYRKSNAFCSLPTNA